MRVGAVNYLNTKPLVEDLDHLAADAQIVFDLPSRLADALAQRQLDVALVPCMELFEDPRYRVVSNACIACRGPVLSVRLFFRTPPSQVRTLALDEGSRTSAAMAQLLLKEQYGLEPGLVTLPIGTGLDSSDADAVLLIGDRAIYENGEGFSEVWDLGDRWCRWTELPFVFALWVAHPDVDVSSIEGPLTEARDRGLANLAAIAAREAAHMHLPTELCLNYLRDNLHFTLGPRERQGLELFYQHTVDMELAPAGWKWDSEGATVS